MLHTGDKRCAEVFTETLSGPVTVSPEVGKSESKYAKWKMVFTSEYMF
jgi:hypothetical protein